MLDIDPIVAPSPQLRPFTAAHNFALCLFTVMFSDDRLLSLPISIHARIFNLFTLQHRLECITVCKAWRSMILGCPEIWKILSTLNSRYIVPELLPYLPYINAKDVKQLQYRSQGDIHNHPTLSMAEARRDTEMLSTMADFVSYKQCDVIEQVDLCTRMIPKKIFLKLTNVCGNSITRLVFTQVVTTSTPFVITPDVLLRQCPNLQKLFLNANVTVPDEYESALKNFKHQHLIELALDTYDPEHTYNIEAVLMAVPKLQQLFLGFGDIARIGQPLSSILREYCPDISIAKLGYDQSIIEARGMLSKPRKSNGQEELYVYNGLNDNYIIQDTISQLIRETHQSLKRLELKKHADPFDSDTCRNSTFALTHLVLDSAYFDLDTLSLTLQHATPNLESLTLKGSDCATDSLLEFIVLGTTQLKEIHLEACPKITSVGLGRFLEGMAKQEHTLQKMTFLKMPQAVTVNVIDIIAAEFIVINDLLISLDHITTKESVSSVFETAWYDMHVDDTLWYDTRLRIWSRPEVAAAYARRSLET